MALLAALIIVSLCLAFSTARTLPTNVLLTLIFIALVVIANKLGAQ